jgi:hypothetical protein
MNPNRLAASVVVLALALCTSGCPNSNIQPGWSDDGGPDNTADSTIPTDSSSRDVTTGTTEGGADTGGGAVQDSAGDALEGGALDAPDDMSVVTDAPADVHADTESPDDASDASTTADVAADAPGEAAQEAGTDDGSPDAVVADAGTD